MAQIPLPKPYQDTQACWQAVKEPRFVIQKCGDCDPESVLIGMKVKVCFDDVTDEVTLTMFKPE